MDEKQGILDEGLVYEEEPVDIEEFINGSKYLDQEYNGRTGCRPFILDVAKNVVEDNVREAILLLGKGSGKDYVSAILHLYGIYKALCMYDPQNYYGIGHGSSIYFINIARNETQGKNVFFKEFIGMLENCPWFENKYRDPSAQKVEFDKKITALSGNSQAFGWLGYNTIQWVGDELAFFLSNDRNEASASNAKECWQAGYGSCISRFPNDYKMVGITTPRHDDDFVMRKFAELERRKDGYAVQAATWDVNPNLTKDDFKYSLKSDYRRTMRDFGAQPVGSLESFWGERFFVRDNVKETCRQCPVWQNRETNNDDFACRDYEYCLGNPYRGNGEWDSEFTPQKGVVYYMHFDLSKNKDRLSFGLGHVADIIEVELDGFEIVEKMGDYADTEDMVLGEEDKFVEKAMIEIDAIGFIDPTSNRDKAMLKNGEIYYNQVYKRTVVYLVNRGFDIGLITFDQYNSIYIKQQIEDLDIETDLISLDRTDEIPVNAKRAFTENRVIYPYCKILSDEARDLQYINGKKVDHPKKGADGNRGSKDVWDAGAGTIHNCEKGVEEGGGFVGLGKVEEGKIEI